jgi:hypothetical protein
MRTKAGRTGPANPFVLVTDPHIFDKDPRGRKRLTYDERNAGVEEAKQIMADAIAMEEAKKTKTKSTEPAPTPASLPRRKKRNPKGKPKKSKTKTNSQVTVSTISTLTTPSSSAPSAMTVKAISMNPLAVMNPLELQWMNAQYMMQLMQMQWMAGNVSGVTAAPQPSEERGESEGSVEKCTE